MAVSGEIIKQTQSSLGQFVKKPPLTEKLLNKPPFRFLHDVITAVIKDTGTLNGLFDGSEMNSDNVKDKESKVEFLGKLIDALSFSTGQTLSAKPGKIVSGQEAEKTNEMLQALAEIIINKVDTADAVKRVRSGEKPGKAKKAGKEEKKGREKSPVKTPSKKDASPAKRDRENKENKVEKENAKNRSPSTKSSRREPMSSPKKNITNGHNDDTENNNGHDLISNGLVAPSESEPLTNGVTDHADISPVRGQGDSGNASPTEEAPPARPKTATRPVTSKDRRKPKKSPSPELTNGAMLSKQNSIESDEPQVLGFGNKDEEVSSAPARPTTSAGARAGSARPRTGRARPPSARPAAPAIKKKREIALEEQPRPATAKVSNVILDDDDEDDGEEFLIEEAPKDPLVSLEAGEEAAVEAGGQEHGVLVQQILETQKELQDGNKRDKKGVEIEREAGVGDTNRARDRESTLREVNKLKSSIQTLTKSAHPLGKLMDFLQEDVDSMQRELDQWKKENQSLQLQLRKEESVTAQTLQPLVATLEDLTTAVNDNLDKISLVKSNILKNEDKIEKMISSMGLAHK